MPDQTLLNSLYRTRFSAFLQKSVEVLFPGRPYRDAMHVQAICFQLEELLGGAVCRLIINIPPRYYKSTIVSVVLSAFLLGLDPTRKIIVVSYSNDLATELHNLTRDLMQSDFYRAVYPKTKIKPGKNTEVEIKTTKNGGRRAASTGSSVTGFGADWIICDDLMKPEDANSDVKRAKTNAYLQNTLLSRLEDKKHGVMVMIQQRLHPDDTTGFALDLGSWRHLKLPAIATAEESVQIGPNDSHTRSPGDPLDPDREDLETLNKIRKEVGELVFSAQWQQEPSLPGGNLLKLEQFRRYDELPPKHHFEYYVQSWDPAVTNSDTSDFSVCTTWAKKGDIYYLVHTFREKLEYPDLEKAVRKLCEEYEPRMVVFEGSHIGQALWSTYDRSDLSYKMTAGQTCFKTFGPRQDKVSRAAIQSVKIERGQVYLPKTADWLEAFETEVRQFPAGRHDDQVDSMVQFLHSMDFRIPRVNI